MRYGAEAKRIAQHERFDIIHAHDWLSFPAGVVAKRVSGKPLIVHVHATEFDRTGGQESTRRCMRSKNGAWNKQIKWSQFLGLPKI